MMQGLKELASLARTQAQIATYCHQQQVAASSLPTDSCHVLQRILNLEQAMCVRACVRACVCVCVCVCDVHKAW